MSEREGERERERETDRQTDRQTERERERETMVNCQMKFLTFFPKTKVFCLFGRIGVIRYVLGH